MSRPNKQAAAGVQGWVQHGVLWQLMENGTASKYQLSQWLDAKLCTVNVSLRALCNKAFVQPLPKSPSVPVQFFGLTPEGIEAALKVTEAHWKSPPPDFSRESKTLFIQGETA